MESRCTVLGHVQRGGTPTAFDRVLSTRYGVAAAQSVLAGNFGIMVSLQKNRIIRVPLAEIAGKASNITADDELLLAGRAIGVCFGD